MSKIDLAQCEAIYFEALEISNAERAAFLAQRCAGNSELELEVSRLLQHHDAETDGNFILDQERFATGEAPNDAQAGERPGDRIGPYRLLEKIGEGGMGVVYMAEQVDGLQRRVALKIVKLGMDTRQVLARFEAEQQALALFEHPGIAKVLDSGVTDGGRPYFVMELVRGTSITEFANDQRLDMRARVELFVEVCAAVQHAHQKGIIHRDLKPSNIMVTMVDGRPSPKIIDLGVAKAIGQRLTEKTVFTRYAAMVGTPQYMSPEQAGMSGSDVDTRSDIYSLGVVLYELLTRSTPLEKSQLKQLNPLELFDTLRDAAYPTPTARIHASTSAMARTAATDVPDLETPGKELDWVVMKAISAERGLRYGTASELAADLRRFLDGDPVLAAPPSRLYPLRIYARKHKTFFAVVLAIGTLLIVGAVISAMLAFNGHRLNQRLSGALAEANQNLRRAESAEQELREINLAQSYENAFSVAFAKFSFFVSEEMVKCLVQEPETQEIDNTPIEWPAGEFPNEDVDLEPICLEFDPNILVEFHLLDSVRLPTERLSSFFVRERSTQTEIEQYLIDANMSDDFMVTNPDHEHSQACLDFQASFRPRLIEIRPVFYRLLVDEYRRVFGESDERVSEALSLLAASLIEVGDNTEAEARLREAIALQRAESGCCPPAA